MFVYKINIQRDHSQLQDRLRQVEYNGNIFYE